MDISELRKLLKGDSRGPGRPEHDGSGSSPHGQVRSGPGHLPGRTPSPLSRGRRDGGSSAGKGRSPAQQAPVSQQSSQSQLSQGQSQAMTAQAEGASQPSTLPASASVSASASSSSPASAANLAGTVPGIGQNPTTNDSSRADNSPAKTGRRVSIRPFSAPGAKEQEDDEGHKSSASVLPGITRVKSATVKRESPDLAAVISSTTMSSAPSVRSPSVLASVAMSGPVTSASQNERVGGATAAVDARRAGMHKGVMPASLVRSRIPEAYHIYNDELVTSHGSGDGGDADDRRVTDGRLVVRRFPLALPTGTRKELVYLRQVVERMLADAQSDDGGGGQEGGYPMEKWRRTHSALFSGLHEMARQVCVGSVERGTAMAELLEKQDSLFQAVFKSLETLTRTLDSAQEGMTDAIEAAEEACRSRIEDIEAVMVERELCLVEHIQVLEAVAKAKQQQGTAHPPTQTQTQPQPSIAGMRKPSFIMQPSMLAAPRSPQTPVSPNAGGSQSPQQQTHPLRKGSINRRNSVLTEMLIMEAAAPPPVDPEQLPVVQSLRSERAVQGERIRKLEEQLAGSEKELGASRALLADTAGALEKTSRELERTRSLYAQFEERSVGKQTAQVWRREKVSRFCMFCESGRLQLLAEIQEAYHKAPSHKAMRELQYWEIELRLLQVERDRLARITAPDSLPAHPLAALCGRAAVEARALDPRRAVKSVSWVGSIVRMAYDAMSADILRRGELLPGRCDVPFAEIVYNTLLTRYGSCAAVDAVALDLVCALKAHKEASRWLGMFSEAVEGRLRPSCLRLRLQVLAHVEAAVRKPVDRETHYAAHVSLEAAQRIACECLPGIVDEDRKQVVARLTEASRPLKGAGDSGARTDRVVAVPVLVDTCSAVFERDVERLDAAVRSHLEEAAIDGFLDFAGAHGVVSRIDPSMTPMDTADAFKAAQRLLAASDPLGSHLPQPQHEPDGSVADARHVARISSGLVSVGAFAEVLHFRGRLFLRPLNLFHIPTRSDLSAVDAGGLFDAMARDWSQSFEPLIDAVLFSLGDVGTTDAAADGALLAETRAKLVHELSARSSLSRTVDLARRVTRAAEDALRHVRGLAAESHSRYLQRELALRRELLAQMSAGAATAAGIQGSEDDGDESAAAAPEAAQAMSLQQRVRQLLLQH